MFCLFESGRFRQVLLYFKNWITEGVVDLLSAESLAHLMQCLRQEPHFNVYELKNKVLKMTMDY